MCGNSQSRLEQHTYSIRKLNFLFIEEEYPLLKIPGKKDTVSLFKAIFLHQSLLLSFLKRFCFDLPRVLKQSNAKFSVSKLLLYLRSFAGFQRFFEVDFLLDPNSKQGVEFFISFLNA
jgi:hypothetical protein